MKLARIAAVLFVTLIAGVAAARPADAAGSISSFTKTSSGNITFTVADITNTALAGSQSYGFALTVTTSATRGSVTVTAPTITGTSGNTIPAAAFSAVCTETSDPNGVFTTLGLVHLSTAAVSCGQLASNTSGTVRFTVTLYIDDAAASASAFTADSYTANTLSVIANAP